MSVEKQLIRSVRSKFLKEFEENSTLYYRSDVNKICINDWSVERFALVHKTEEASLKALVKAMRWRREFGLLNRNDQDFPKELYQAGIYNNYLKDRGGREVLLIVLKNVLKTDMIPIFKQFILHQIEKLDSQTSHQGWGLIVNTKGCGLANVDLDLSFWGISTLQDCYPRGYKYILVLDVPLVLSATWKVLNNFMSEEFRRTFQVVSRQEILEDYVDSDKMPIGFGGTCDKPFVFVPEGVQPLDKMPQFGLSEKQIEKIRSAHKDVFKENGF